MVYPNVPNFAALDRSRPRCCVAVSPTFMQLEQTGERIRSGQSVAFGISPPPLARSLRLIGRKEKLDDAIPPSLSSPRVAKNLC